MGYSCCVNGCSSNSHSRKVDRGIRFFTFPTWKRGFGKQVENITKRRRTAWVAAVKRKDITFHKMSSYVRVCSRHFHKGQPAYEMLETDPDWAPSLHLGHTSVKPTDAARAARRSRREQLRKSRAQAAKTGVQQAGDIVNEVTQEAAEDSGPLQKDVGKEEAAEVLLSSGHESHNTNQEVDQTECNLCMLMCTEVNRLLEENRELRRELDELRISDDFFGEDDEKVKYYTGLPNLVTFMTLFNFLLPLMSTQNKVLTPFQIFLITFMRLRLNLPAEHLAHLFRVSPNTVNSTFSETVSFLYVNLKRAIVWPDRDTLHKMMPHQFVEAFGHRVAVIIDCFEVFTETPSNLEAPAKMLSSFQRNHTMKYLVGITPRGAICFLSRGWEGHTSDEHLTLNSGFLDNLLPGDVVLAEKGFEIQENIGMLCAEVKPPALTKGSCQLAARDVEETGKIAHLRTHIERVVGNFSQKYKILSGAIPINKMPCEGEDVTLLDKIVTVCCALTNLCAVVV
ncbi:uncharacterized protein LOC125010113 [Mugil cephalus]|uniref:uncharacterized protein LOC125010113 n=1 Tax=Mugil cephalus TaxID=48193 RepID=UPI001FB6E844|nr:uncharacterized protein LOC125010113 [Mugil cephalus]